MAWGESQLNTSGNKKKLTFPSPRLHGPRVDHDSRCRTILLRSLASEKRPLHDLPLHGWYRCRFIPMVLLGLFLGFLGHWLKVSQRSFFSSDTPNPELLGSADGVQVHW